MPIQNAAILAISIWRDLFNLGVDVFAVIALIALVSLGIWRQ